MRNNVNNKGRTGKSGPVDATQKVIPVGVLLATGAIALLFALAASVWVGVALIVLALCMTAGVVAWARARARGDALVTAVAILLFWMPFQVTISRFNVSPQELGVYIICVVAAIFDRRGIWRWIKELFTSTTLWMRLAILVFALACLQAFVRVVHLGLLSSIGNLRMVVLYPMLFAFLVAYTMRTRNAERTLLQVFVVGAVAFAAFALSLPIWGVNVGNGAVEGRLGAEASFLAVYHPNNLALYLVLALAFVPGIISQAIQSYQQGALETIGSLVGTEVAFFLGTQVMLLAIWKTYSRGAVVALVIGVVAALGALALWRIGRPSRRPIGILGIVVVALAGLLIWNGSAILGRYASLLDPSKLLSDPDVTFRVDVYTRALRLIVSHPITGIGLQQFASTGNAPFSPHNTYLDLWVSAGIFATLAFVIVLLLGLRAAFARAHHFSKSHDIIAMLYSLGFVIALTVFAVQGFVEAYDTNLRITPVVWMLALCADGMLLGLRGQRRVGVQSTSSEPIKPTEPARPIAIAEGVEPGEAL